MHRPGTLAVEDWIVERSGGHESVQRASASGRKMEMETGSERDASGQVRDWALRSGLWTTRASYGQPQTCLLTNHKTMLDPSFGGSCEVLSEVHVHQVPASKNARRGALGLQSTGSARQV